MSINKFIGIGRLTKNPEIRYAPSGTAITTFSIAINETWKDQTGKKQEKVEYINIVTFGKLAEICGEFLTKGKQVYIEGKIQTRSWDDKDGNKKYMTEIVASTMQMLDSKGSGATDGGEASVRAGSSPQDNMPPLADDEVPF